MAEPSVRKSKWKAEIKSFLLKRLKWRSYSQVLTVVEWVIILGDVELDAWVVLGLVSFGPVFVANEFGLVQNIFRALLNLFATVQTFKTSQMVNVRIRLIAGDGIAGKMGKLKRDPEFPIRHRRLHHHVSFWNDDFTSITVWADSKETFQMRSHLTPVDPWKIEIIKPVEILRVSRRFISLICFDLTCCNLLCNKCFGFWRSRIWRVLLRRSSNASNAREKPNCLRSPGPHRRRFPNRIPNRLTSAFCSRTNFKQIKSSNWRGYGKELARLDGSDSAGTRSATSPTQPRLGLLFIYSSTYYNNSHIIYTACYNQITYYDQHIF